LNRKLRWDRDIWLNGVLMKKGAAPVENRLLPKTRAAVRRRHLSFTADPIR